MWWTGVAISVIVVLFLLMDAGAKLAAIRPVLEAGEQIGFPGVSMARALGAVLLVCTLLYVFPKTGVLGAILLTAYLGGAVATHLRLGSPLFTHVLFGVYVGILMWTGLVLRQPALRAWLPFSS
jgi:hypothetical protein